MYQPSPLSVSPCCKSKHGTCGVEPPRNEVLMQLTKCRDPRFSEILSGYVLHTQTWILKNEDRCPVGTSPEEQGCPPLPSSIWKKCLLKAGFGGEDGFSENMPTKVPTEVPTILGENCWSCFCNPKVSTQNYKQCCGPDCFPDCFPNCTKIHTPLSRFGLSQAVDLDCARWLHRSGIDWYCNKETNTKYVYVHAILLPGHYCDNILTTNRR